MKESKMVAEIMSLFVVNEILTAGIISNLLFPRSDLKESKRIINRVLYKHEGELWYRIEGNKWTLILKSKPKNAKESNSNLRIDNKLALKIIVGHFIEIQEISLFNFSERQKYVLQEIAVNQRKYKEVAEDMGLTSERIRQIFVSSINKFSKELVKIYNSCIETRQKNAELERINNDLCIENIYLRNELSKVNKSLLNPKMESKSHIENKLLLKSITELDFPVRAVNCFKRHGILTLGDLIQRSKEEILSFENFGKFTLRQVEHELRGLNIIWDLK